MYCILTLSHAPLWRISSLVFRYYFTCSPFPAMLGYALTNLRYGDGLATGLDIPTVLYMW